MAHDRRGLLKVSIDNQRHFLHQLVMLCVTGAMAR